MKNDDDRFSKDWLMDDGYLLNMVTGIDNKDVDRT